MRFAKLIKDKATLEKQIRVNDESDEKLKIIQEEKEALEEEFEIVKKRLENLDPVYKWENAIYQKIANILKRAQVSPVQAFEEFDEGDVKMVISAFYSVYPNAKGDITFEHATNVIKQIYEQHNGRK